MCGGCNPGAGAPIQGSMRRAGLALLICMLSPALAAAQSPGLLPEAVRDSLRAAVGRHMRERGIPGLSLAIGRPDGAMVTEVFGDADLEQRVPVTPATLFRLQSAQKLLTATAVLRLVEQGRLGLDDPVVRHCPAFGVRPWPVTVRQLLTHQAGVRPSDLADLFNRAHFTSPAAALARVARDSLVARPGTKVVYSNAGYTVLACVIEGAAGGRYDAALAALVLRPAAMTATRDDNVYQVIPGRARYYVMRTAANTEQWRGLWTDAHLSSTPLDRAAVADPVDPSWAIGAGSYLGTPSDLVRFGLALRGGALLRSAVRDSALTGARLEATGEAAGRTLGGWVLDPGDRGVLRVVGSSWNGSFAIGLDSASGAVAAIASNIEFDQPTELLELVLRLWRLEPE